MYAVNGVSDGSIHHHRVVAGVHSVIGAPYSIDERQQSGYC